MRSLLLLARRYLAYHRGRTALLVASIALVAFLPIAVQLLMSVYGERLAARAASTPLVVGARGSRYDLVLSTLYFTGRTPRALSMADVDELAEGGLATPIPVLARHTARGAPVVGTTYEYFDLRGLACAAGTPPLVLGDAVLGSRVARRLGLGPGDALLSDPESVYDLSAGLPLKMRVSGVLAETRSPDDDVVLVDLKTAWVLDGIVHGHAGEQDDSVVLEREEGAVLYNAKLYEHTEITPENVDSFHFHAGRDELPVTGVIAVPADERAATLLKGRYRISESAQVLVPSEVIDELLGFVVRLKRFFDANLVLVGTATGLLLVLVVLLTLRVRRREMETLFMIGCARRTTARLVAMELGIIVGAGLALALGAAALAVALASRGGLAGSLG